MPIFPSQLRIAAKCLMMQRRHPLTHIRHRDRDHHWQRDFSQTSRRQAAEDPNSILAQLQASPLIQKIADKPEALKALNNFANVMKEADVTLSPERPPSMMQMFKLASNTKFREAAKQVVEELKKAGVDINAENALELFGLKKPPSR
ncbi:hypothetical protein DFH11DRAFT_1540527 [Phellopilus nigrolimitatus]|nr:hypothetical protein DFH11DRAFT_1540527 [Phellopilus nigrolimitatus]